MAGAIDLKAGSSALAGSNLFQVDKNPLNQLDQGVQGVVGKQAASTATQITTLFQGFLNGMLGLHVDGSGGNAGLTDLNTYFGNLETFLGELNPLDPNFNLDAAAHTFINSILLPTNLLPLLSGGLLSPSTIPLLDASKIGTGTLSAGVLQPLIDAVSTGFGGGSGLGFTSLTSLLSGIPGAQQLIDAIASALGISGTGHSTTQVTSYLQAIPGGNIASFLSPAVVPLLDASTIGSGSFPQSMITGLAGALAGFLTGTSALNAANLSGYVPQSLLALVPYTAIGDFAANLLVNPTFDTVTSLSGLTSWSWDGAVNHSGSGGSATATADSSPHELTSDPRIPVAPGQTLSVSNWVRWRGVTATGPAFQLGVNVYNAANGLIASPVLATISSPAANSSNAPEGDFVQLSGTYTVPAGAASLEVRLTMLAAVTAGQSWWDDGFLGKTQPIKQDWIQGLLTQLQGIGSTGAIDASWLSNMLNIPGLDAGKIITGIFGSGLIPGLDASKIITGIFGTGFIPNLPAGQITSGTFGSGLIPGLDASKIISGAFGSSLIPGLDVSKIVSGVFGTGFIPNLPAGQITSGTFGSGLIPGLDASKIISGLFGTGLIPGLDAAKIVSGLFGSSLIPGLDASKIVSGTLVNSFVPGVGTLMDSIVQGFGLTGTGHSSTDVQNQSTLVNHTATSAQATAAANSAMLQATLAAQNAGPAGSNFNFVFSGSDGTTLAGADFTTGPTSNDIVIRAGNPIAAGIKSGNGNHVAYYAICAHALTTDDQSVAVILGDQGGASSTNTTVYAHCNATMSEGSYCKANNGGFEVGYFTMTGGAFTYTPFVTATSMTLQTGYRVELRNVGNTHYVYINGVRQFSFTDTGNHVTMDASHRQGGFSLDRASVAGWFGSTTYDSFRVASFSLADYSTGGAGVTTPSWAIRRNSATNLTVNIINGGQGLPTNYFDTNDYATGVTVTTLGSGVITIGTGQAGFYEVNFTAYAQDTLSIWVPIYYALLHNGTIVTGPIPCGVPFTLYLDAGDTINPQITPVGWRQTGSGSQVATGESLQALNSGMFVGYRRSAEPAATWT